MRAKSIKGRSPREIQSAFSESMADGFKPTVAIVFISIKQDLESVREILRRENIDILGATSARQYGWSPKGKRRIHSTTCSWVALKEK